MVGTNFPEAVVGLLLVFFVPGYALTRATFPEWRLRGPEAPMRLLETFTLSFALSVVLTVLVGYALLAAAPGGFQPYWTEPVLEAVLAGIAAVGFVVGWLRGAYEREPPRPVAYDPATGDDGAWEVTRELDALAREERRLRHRLRTVSNDPAETHRIEEELGRLRSQRLQLQERREAEYAT